MNFNLSTDPEPMLTAIGVQWDVTLETPTQAKTDSLVTVVQTRLKRFCCPDYLVGPGWVNWGDVVGEDRFDGSINTVAGTAATNPLPQNCSTLIRKGVVGGGRRNQGRMYVPGLGEDKVASNGAITAAERALLQTSIDAMLTDLEAVSFVQRCVVFHNSAPFAPSGITSFTVQQFIATQRRRLRR